MISRIRMNVLTTSIDFAPYGNKIVAACSRGPHVNGHISIIDVATAEVCDVISQNDVRCVVWSPCGQWLAAARDTKVDVYDAQTFELKWSNGHHADVHCVVFSPDGLSVASCSGGHPDRTSIEQDCSVRIWTSQTGHELMHLEGHKTFFCLAFSPDGKHIAAGDGDGVFGRGEKSGTVRLYCAPLFKDKKGSKRWGLSILTTKLRNVWRRIPSYYRFKNHFLDYLPISFQAYVPISFRFGPASDFTGLLRVNPVTHITFHPKDNIVVICSLCNVKLWNLDTGAMLCALNIYGVFGTFAALSVDGCKIAVFTRGAVDFLAKEFEVKFFSMKTKKVLCILKFDWPVSCLNYSPDGKFFVVGYTIGDSTELQFFDAQTQAKFGSPVRVGKTFATLNYKWDRLQLDTVQFSPNGDTLAVGADKLVHLIDTATAKVKRQLRDHNCSVMAVAWSPCGRWLASVGDDKMVLIFDAEKDEVKVSSLISLSRRNSFNETKITKIEFAQAGVLMWSERDVDVVRERDARDDTAHISSTITRFLPLVNENDEGNPVSLGNDWNFPGYKGSDKYYCGQYRNVGDGQCGPSAGPQCASCTRFQRVHTSQYQRKEQVLAGQFALSNKCVDGEQQVGRFVMTALDNCLRVFKAPGGLPGTEGAEGQDIKDSEDSQKKPEPIAWFCAPSLIVSVKCSGTNIVVGCVDGEVLFLRMAVLLT